MTGAPRTGFEGSYLGTSAKISPLAVMECKVCWTPYDPDVGDEHRQIDPGTPFSALPEDWSCPNCSAPKAQFLVNHDAGSEAAQEQARVDAAAARLEAEFREIWNGKMRDVPLVNAALQVEAVGFALYEGRPLGVLVSPWFMNLVMLPGEGEDWSGLSTGTTEVIAFGSGDYEFTRAVRPIVGGYKACSLFSPMGEFTSQAKAVEVARAVLALIHDPAHRAETDRSADIRAAREAELAPPTPVLPAEPSRRAVISGGLA